MVFPKHTPLYAKNPKAIITEACKTLGIDVESFVRTLETDLDCDIDLENPLASEWIYMCELLALEYDSISYGYLNYFHKKRIKRYNEEKITHQELFPKTYKVVSTHINLVSNMHLNGGDLHA